MSWILQYTNKQIELTNENFRICVKDTKLHLKAKNRKSFKAHFVTERLNPQASLRFGSNLGLDRLFVRTIMRESLPADLRKVDGLPVYLIAPKGLSGVWGFLHL